MTTFNPAAEHRCARCGQWWWSTHACPDQLGRVVPPDSMPFEVTTTDKIIAERDALRALNRMLRAELQSTKDALRAEVEALRALLDRAQEAMRGPIYGGPVFSDAIQAVMKEIDAARAAQEGKT